MKKVFALITILFCIVMSSFSIYYKKTEKVLIAGELMAFQIEDSKEAISDEGYINTSLKELGIITYINPKTNQFAALGHSIINGDKGTDIEGTCYNVVFKDKQSNIKDVYLDETNPIGYVYYDNYSGIYGKVHDISEKKYEEIETANRYNIKKGEANILIRLDGENLKSYKVEITGINYFDSNKNIRIKITDEALINATGGIIQGMSGTPVIQNGKLIGAINCVNISNPQDAYAIFIDKII